QDGTAAAERVKDLVAERQLVDQVGGVRLAVAKPAMNRGSGIALPVDEGRQVGAEAEGDGGDPTQDGGQALLPGASGLVQLGAPAVEGNVGHDVPFVAGVGENEAADYTPRPSRYSQSSAAEPGLRTPPTSHA